ncbi:MAG: N-terminal phage integrase SAM-like domain-containing protein, partial [Myxococcota bacterium]
MKRTKTKYHGVYWLPDKKRYWLRLKLTTKSGSEFWKTKTCPVGLTLDQAQAALVTFKALQQSQLAASQPLDQIITVADYADHWLPAKRHSLAPSTLDRYERDLSYHLLPFLGERRIRGLARDDVKDWVIYAQSKTMPCGDMYGWETLEGWWRILRQLLQDAHADGLMDKDPTYRVKGPKRRGKKKREQDTLSRGQLAALLEAMRQVAPQRYAEALCLACTGMRP